MNKIFDSKDMDFLPRIANIFEDCKFYWNEAFEWGVEDNLLCLWRNGERIQEVPITKNCIENMFHYMMGYMMGRPESEW
jgi:hypothetical protein